MSDLSEGRQLLAWVNSLADQPGFGACPPGCAAHGGGALDLSARLAQLADHPDLGVGEARAALAEAAATLLYLGRPCRAAQQPTSAR